MLLAPTPPHQAAATGAPADAGPCGVHRDVDDPPQEQDEGSVDRPGPEGGTAARPAIPGVFLILGQDYTAELVTVQLPAGT